MQLVLLELTLVVVKTILARVSGAATLASEHTNTRQNALAVTHVVLPFTDVALLVVLVELLSDSVSHVRQPIANIERLAVVEAFTVLTFAVTVTPGTLVLVASCLLTVGTYEHAIAFILLP